MVGVGDRRHMVGRPGALQLQEPLERDGRPGWPRFILGLAQLQAGDAAAAQATLLLWPSRLLSRPSRSMACAGRDELLRCRGVPGQGAGGGRSEPPPVISSPSRAPRIP
jgi:hypothetical protein